MRQHSVPQFHLREWVAVGDSRLFVFDKKEGRVFRAPPKDVAVSAFYYDEKGGPADLEKRLTKLETKTGPLLQRITERRSIRRMDARDWAWVALFLTVQWFRTEATRARYRQIIGAMRRELAPMAVEKLRLEMEEADPKEMHVFSLLDLKDIYEIVVRMVPCVQLNDTGYALTTSDNPVYVDNVMDKQGSAVGKVGAVVHFPLSPTVGLLAIDGRAWPGLVPARLPFDSRENVVYERSRQCGEAVRFVFSNADDFELERRMIDEHPELRDPDRPRLAMLWQGRDIIRSPGGRTT